MQNPMGADAHPSTPVAEEIHDAPAKRNILARIGRWLTVPTRRPRKPAVPPVAPVAETGTPRRGDRVILGAAVTVLLGVAAAAGYVSFHHFYGLATRLGESADMALLYPAMSDGVIVMASLVMVYCSRRRMPVPLLAKAALALGGAVTLVANVAHGWDGGLGSRLLSALAPVAFVGAYELLMWLVRSARQATTSVPATPENGHVCHPAEKVVEVEREVLVLAVDRHEAARLTFEDSLKPGNKRIGRRILMSRWGLEQREADEIIAEVERGQSEDVEPEAAEESVTKRAVRWGDRVVPSVNGSSATGTAVAP